MTRKGLLNKLAKSVGKVEQPKVAIDVVVETPQVLTSGEAIQLLDESSSLAGTSSGKVQMLQALTELTEQQESQFNHFAITMVARNGHYTVYKYPINALTLGVGEAEIVADELDRGSAIVQLKKATVSLNLFDNSF
jgi:hypothetical protein